MTPSNDVFSSTFLLILVAELADKSRLAGLILATTFRARGAVFWGMTCGYVLLDGLAVWAGQKIGMAWPVFWVTTVAGLLFIFFGFASWVWGERLQSESRKWINKYERWGPFWVSFLTIGISEFGDRTQLATGALAAGTGQPASVLFGALSALSVLNFLTVWLGGKISQKLPHRLIHRIAGLIFLGLGAWMLIKARTLSI